MNDINVSLKATGQKLHISKEEVLNDYKIAYLSRQLSLLGRKEVLTGKANFGIFGDGKEVAQIVYAKFFKNGDWRSGYYRDQTFMLALGLTTPEDIFHQIYGNVHPDRKANSTGRNFNNHYYTPNISENGEFLNLAEQKNSSSDISPTSGQMPRLLGLAYASKLFKNNKDLHRHTHLSDKGNELAFGTIGEATTAEGQFFETINAACVLQVPMAVVIYDDGFGISVPVELQIAKSSISEILKGFELNEKGKGCLIYKVQGWNYPELVRVLGEGTKIARENHIPVIFHINEMIQHQGHSTSGSHERYKSKERLEWEKKFDPVKKFKEWILIENIAGCEELINIEIDIKQIAKEARNRAWNSFTGPFKSKYRKLIKILGPLGNNEIINNIISGFKNNHNANLPNKKSLIRLAKNILIQQNKALENSGVKNNLLSWLDEIQKEAELAYNRDLINEKTSIFDIISIEPVYTENSVTLNGREILNKNFEYLFENNPLLVTFGQDTGKIGDVNQVLKGLQQKFGELRITDSGIREATIIGQAIGLALRGLRPIAEIQYLDYLIYALNVLSDDLASLHYRTDGNQIAPVIIRTRGHRLEGIWHSGSPMGMIINSLRGIHLCVPRNMTQAAGMYNTLLKGNDPGIVIEALRGYQEKEILPENIGEFTVPLGVPEVLAKGADITLVTYGWNVKIAQNTIPRLANAGISVELIDVQTLMPFDIDHIILKSIQKTNKVVFLDEDVPGGASAYMMQKVLEEQKAFDYLDYPAKTITAKAHRPAYGTDGDYFSKPNQETIFEAIYNIINNLYPEKYPDLY